MGLFRPFKSTMSLWGPNERKYTSAFHIHGCYVCLGNTLQGFTYPSTYRYRTKGFTLLTICAKSNTNVKNNIYYSKSKCVINEVVGKPTKKTNIKTQQLTALEDITQHTFLYYEQQNIE
jgi:hypothetical protein